MSTHITLWMVISIIGCHHIVCQSMSNSDISISQSHEALSSSNMEHAATLEPSYTSSVLQSSAFNFYTLNSDNFVVSSIFHNVVQSDVNSNTQSSFSSEDVMTLYQETERPEFSLSGTYIESHTMNNMDLSTSLSTVISEYPTQRSMELTQSDSVASTFSSIYSSSIYVNGTTESGDNDLKTNSALLISSVSISSFAQNTSLSTAMGIYLSDSISSVSDKLVEPIASSSIQITQTITNEMSISETRISEVYSTLDNLQPSLGASFVSDFTLSTPETLDSSSMEASPAFETMYTVTMDYSSTSMDNSFISPIDAIESSQTVLESDVSQQSDMSYFTKDYTATQMTDEMVELSPSLYTKLSTALATIQIETISEMIAATEVSSIMLSSSAVQPVSESVKTGAFVVSQASKLFSTIEFSDSVLTIDSDSLNQQTPLTITPSSYLQSTMSIYANVGFRSTSFSEGVTSSFEIGESSESNSISTNLLGTYFIETDISIASTSLQVSTIQISNNVSDMSTISTSIFSDSNVTVTNRETNFDSTVSFAQTSLFTSHVNIESSILEPSNVSPIGTIDLDFSSDTPSYNTFDLSLSSQNIRTTFSDFSATTTLIKDTGITDLPFPSIQGSDIAATKSIDSSGFIQTVSTFGQNSATNPLSSESVDLSPSQTLVSSISGQEITNSDALSITANILPSYSNAIQTSDFHISESSMLIEKSSSSVPLLETSEYLSVTTDTIVTKIDSTVLFATISTEQSSERQSFFTTTSQFNEVSSALTIDYSSLGMTSTLSSNGVLTSLSTGPFDLSLNTISSLPSESTYQSEMSVITSTPLYSLTDISSVMTSNDTLLPTMVSTTSIGSQFDSSPIITLSPSSVPLKLSPFSSLETNSEPSMLSDDLTSTVQSSMPSIDISSSSLFLQGSSSVSEFSATHSTLRVQTATALSVSTETIETRSFITHSSQTELSPDLQTFYETYDSSLFSKFETISPTSILIEESSDALQQTSNIISHTQNTASVDSFSTLSDVDISMFSISPTDILSSIVVTTANSSDILMTSVDSTNTLSTSIMPSVTDTTNSTTTTSSSATTPTTTETTPQTPPQTTDNITNTDESFWVKTVLSVRKTVDISSLSFREDVESRLAEAYNEAFERERLIAQGLFENLRRRRYVNVGDASVHIHDVSRLGDTTSVNVVYAVEKSGTKLSPAEAVTSLNVLSTQELAIILRQVVQTVAEPYQSSSTPNDTEDGGIPLWLVAAITGSVGGFIILVWVFVCVYMKCCREKKELEKQVELELTSIQQDAARREPQRRDVNTNGVGTSARKPLPHQASKASLTKKSSAYQMKPSDEEALIEATPEPEAEEHVYENRIPVQEQMYENKLVTQAASPPSRHRSPKIKKSENRPDGTGSTTSLSHKRDIEQASNTKKGKQRSSKLSGMDGPLPGMDYQDNLDKPRLLKYQVLQSSFSDQDNEDLRERALLERQRNKERIRNKRRKAKHKEDVHPTSVLYSTMGIPSTPLPSVQVESGSPVRDTNNRRASRNLDGCVSTENLSGDESLHEARTRMHKLLDDAFSLISPRASFTENNFPRPTESQGGIYINKDDGLPTGNQSHQHIDGHRGRDVKHEPMYVNPFYSESTFPLETWSPYRTSDLVAMISMPSQQETTKLGQKPKSATRPSSSKPNRRPAANFDFNETKSASTFEEDRFTTSPAKPIVIRSRDSTENTPSNNNRQSNNRLSSGRATVMVSPLPKTTQNEQYEMNSIPKGSSRNGSAGRNKSRSIDRSNVDEVDVINDLDVGQNSDKLIKSLRDELGELKELYSVPNTRVQRKKNKKNTQDSNTEAV